MRFAKFVSIVAASALACGVAGCSSDDGTTPDDDAGQDASTDTSIDTGTDAAKDAGKDSTVIDAQPDVAKDTGSDGTTDAADGATDASDGGVSDAGDGGDASLPPSGSPCNQPNTVQQQDCGLCGFQKRACLPDGDGGYVWGDWGFCQNQVVNGCDPKLSYPDTSCGNCGTKKQVCLPNCNFDATQACTEPPNACKPQSTEFVLGLSCDGGGRERTCDNQCKFGNFGACQSGPSIPGVTASQNVNGIVSMPLTLPASPKLLRTDYSVSCPFSTISSTATSYVYASVKNPSNVQSVKVSIWSAQAQNGPTIDTILTAYPGAVPPADNDATARKNCLVYVSDTCSETGLTPTSCSGQWAGLMAAQGRNVTIPPGGTIVVYIAAWSASSSGDLVMGVRSDSFF
jgi:hypothetical protein